MSDTNANETPAAGQPAEADHGEGFPAQPGAPAPYVEPPAVEIPGEPPVVTVEHDPTDEAKTRAQQLAEGRNGADASGDAALPAVELEKEREEFGDAELRTNVEPEVQTTTDDEQGQAPEADVAVEGEAPRTDDDAEVSNIDGGDSTTDVVPVAESTSNEPAKEEVPSSEHVEIDGDETEGGTDLEEPVQADDESEEDFQARVRSWRAKKAAATRKANAEKEAAGADSAE